VARLVHTRYRRLSAALRRLLSFPDLNFHRSIFHRCSRYTEQDDVGSCPDHKGRGLSVDSLSDGRNHSVPSLGFAIRFGDS
jgi:hypothetical protein